MDMRKTRFVALVATGNEPFRVAGRQTQIVTTFRPDQRAWYAAYERDHHGQPIDEVIDWAAVEYAVLRQDKVFAMDKVKRALAS